MLRATGLAHVPEEAPLVELLRALADEMDNEPGARVRAEYLSALKDVRRVLNSSGGRPRGSADTPAPAVAPDLGDAALREAEATPNDLARFKEKHKIA
jgi:hypothetical protein